MTAISRNRLALDFVFSNRLHVISMGGVIVAFWNQLLQLVLDVSAYVSIIGAVLFAYLINMYFDEREDAANAEIVPGRIIPRSRVAAWLATATFGLTAAVAAMHEPWYALGVCVVMISAGAYSAPVPLGGKRVRLKTLPYVKNLYSALHWSVVLIGLALIYSRTPATPLAVLIMAICFGMNFFVELLWDVRDLAGDRLTQVMTIPNQFGLTVARWLLHLTHLAVCALVVAGMLYGLLPTGFLLIFVHLFAMIAFTEWYFRLDDKRLASHLYVLYVIAALFAISVLNEILPAGAVHLLG
jgi:4-hydroxybenzoate polyprenyltransferase